MAHPTDADALVSSASLPLDPWAWLARLRRGKPAYQPATTLADADDPNGCIPKLELLLGCHYDVAGKRVISLGASGGLYEYHLARRAIEVRGRGISAAHLVDSDEASLHDADRRFAGLAVDDFQLFRCLAHEFRFEGTYDICLFLSLFHHYDRLGPTIREQGFELLRDIGRRCTTLFFETGQSDDTVPGADLWPTFLEMARYPSPSAWLESRVPELTGYDAFRRLGINPRTRRQLYVYWRARPLNLAPAFGRCPFVPADIGSPRGDAEAVVLRVDVTPSGVVGCAAPDDRAELVPLETALDRVERRDVLVDCVFTGAGTADIEWAPALARVVEALRAVPNRHAVLGLRNTAAMRAVPSTTNVCLVVAGGGDPALRCMHTAAYSGVPVVCLEEGADTGAARVAAEEFGIRLIRVRSNNIRL